MDQQPSKRRGRPPKSVGVPADVAQSEGQSANNAGDGQTGAVGTAAQTDADGSGSWDSFSRRVIEASKMRGRGFMAVSHPEPQADVIEAEWPILVVVGEMRI